MGYIGCVCRDKLRCDFVARTFALVRNVLPRVPLDNITIPNAPKMKRNAPKQEFRVEWGGSGVFVATNTDATSWHKLLY